MDKKVAVVVGVTDEHSIAWGIAEALAKAGHEIVMTSLTEKIKDRTKELADSIHATQLLLNVNNVDDLDALAKALDGFPVSVLVHSVAFAPSKALSGRLLDVTPEDFATTTATSAFSLVRLVRALEWNLQEGSSVITLSYLGAARVVPGYGVMGVAKATLEAIVRQLAAELGSWGITVNALSAGPIRTRAARGLPEFDSIAESDRARSFTGRSVTIDDVGHAAVWLTGARNVTGQTIYIDGGRAVRG